MVAQAHLHATAQALTPEASAAQVWAQDATPVSVRVWVRVSALDVAQVWVLISAQVAVAVAPFSVRDVVVDAAPVWFQVEIRVSALAAIRVCVPDARQHRRHHRVEVRRNADVALAQEQRRHRLAA